MNRRLFFYSEVGVELIKEDKLKSIEIVSERHTGRLPSPVMISLWVISSVGVSSSMGAIVPWM